MHAAFDILVDKKKEKLLEKDWVKVFPNPFNNAFTIFIKAEITGKLSTQLTDMSGRTLKTSQLDVIQGQFYTISEDNLGAIPRGVYNLRVINGSQHRTIRLVK